MSALDLDALEAKARAARPGPWAWYGNTRMTDVYLATVRGGRNYVMDFVRWGVRGAQPRFNVGGIMRTTKELATGECFSIDHPDAAFIAACDPTTVLALITSLRAAEARTAWQPIETAPMDEWVAVIDGGVATTGAGSRDGEWWDRRGVRISPTAWTALPAAPEAP